METALVQILELRPRERVTIDSARLDALYRRQGARAAEDFLAERVEQISDRLADIDWLHRSGLSPEIAVLARQVSVVAGEVGLGSLARVAADLAAAVGASDWPTYHAVWERLVRIGDESLAGIWETPSLRM